VIDNKEIYRLFTILKTSGNKNIENMFY